MHPRRQISRPLLPALWFGIAALVLQAFGAALHARTHHAQVPLASAHAAHAALVADSGVEHTHEHVHGPSHCDGYTHHDHSEPSNNHRHATHPADPAPHAPHDECPTCLKVLSNARSALAPTSEPSVVDSARREPPILGAARAHSLPLLRVQPARAPPMGAPAIA